MGWSWATACGIQGRGHIVWLCAQLVIFGGDVNYDVDTRIFNRIVTTVGWASCKKYV